MLLDDAASPRKLGPYRGLAASTPLRTIPEAPGQPSMSTAEFNLEADSTLCRIGVQGSLLGPSAEELRDFVLECASRRPPIVILDFRGVDHLDTRGIGVLVALRNRLRRGGTSLRIETAEGPVLRVIRTLRLAEALGVAVPEPARPAPAPRPAAR